MKKVSLILGIMLLSLSVRAGDVETDFSSVFMGVRTGVLFVDTLDSGHEMSGGVFIGFRFNQSLALELSYDDHFSGIFGAGWSTDAYQATLQLYLPVNGPMQPYIQGGVGVYLSTYNYWASDGYDSVIITEVDEADGGFHAGGGIDFRVSDNVSITLDTRYIFVEEDFPGEHDSDGFLATAGVKFIF